MLILIIQIVMHLFIEPLHDAAVIDAGRNGDPGKVKRWHLIDAIMWMAVWACVAVAADYNWFYLASGLAIRWCVFNPALNWVRRLPVNHLGTNWLDRAESMLPVWLRWFLRIAILIILVWHELG